MRNSIVNPENQNPTPPIQPTQTVPTAPPTIEVNEQKSVIAQPTIPSVIQDTPKPKSKIIPLLVALLILLGLGSLGYWAYQNYFISSKKTAESSSLNPVIISPTPMATLDLTANWKTYTNNIWNYSFKYPTDELTTCDYSTTESGVQLWKMPWDCSPTSDNIYEISILGLTSQEYTSNEKPTKTESILVDGKPATRNSYTFENDSPFAKLGGSTEIIIPTSGGIIQLLLLGTDLEKIQRFDQILSTFKFTK